MSGLREALEELIEKAGDQRSMPLLVPVRVVPVAALRQLLDAYPEEKPYVETSIEVESPGWSQ